MLKINEKARIAIYIGTLCSVSYLAVYFARNILSAVTPQMTEIGGFSESYIGKLESAYLICYAFGQLINGAIGDKIKAKYMISAGLFLSGITSFIFTFISGISYAAIAVYGLTGFFLSMIYGPMTKVVAENTEPIYAPRCSLGYTFASFFGTPLAGVAATYMIWYDVFKLSGTLLAVMAILCFVFFLYFERIGIVKYGQYKAEKVKNGSINVLIKHHIIKFSFIAMLTGIVRTTVMFWFPTYISQYLDFPHEEATMIFTVASFIISTTAFIAIFIYERLKRNMDLTILIMFSSSTIFFIAVYFLKAPVVNIILMVLAIMSASAAATMLYSRYCPSLRDTGMVSGATGFLDFLSYTAASATSTFFAESVSTIGWGNLILIWAALMFFGIIVALPYGAFFKKASE
ncbi:MAG: MFS transporter [Ruminococcaceae bacterium]|nr:MFS transporter [Oscillospiraceae bacterium]